MTTKFTLALLVILAFADLSKASTATKGLSNAKRKVDELKKGTVPAFVQKPAGTSKPSSIKVSKSTAVAFGMILASTAGVMNGACLSGLVSGTGQVRFGTKRRRSHNCF